MTNTDILNALRAEEAALKAQLNPPRLATDDATPEAMSILLNQNNGTLASLSADARTAIKRVIGKGSNEGTAEDLLLKAFSGDIHRQDRVTRGEVATEPVLTLNWLTQLDSFENLYKPQSLSDSGLLCRILPYDFRGWRPPAEYEEVEIPSTVLDEFYKCVWELLKTYHQHKGTNPLLISGDQGARKVLVDYEHQVRDQIESGELAEMEDFAARWAEHAWRLALVFHAAEHGSKAHSVLVNEQTAAAAVEVVQWFSRKQQAIMRVAGASKEDAKLATARDFVQKSPSGVTARDVHRHAQTKFKKTEDALRTLRALVAEGSIREETTGKGPRFFPRKMPKQK